MMDEEKNRAISESLESAPTWEDSDIHWMLSDGLAWHGRHSSNGVLELQRARDWHADETASVLLLEHMPCPALWREDEGLWACWADMEKEPEEGYAHHRDRKTAIRDAYYALIMEAK